MAVITPERIKELIEEAPAWAKVGLTVPNERLRDDATTTLAEHVYSSLFQPIRPDASQLALPL